MVALFFHPNLLNSRYQNGSSPIHSKGQMCHIVILEFECLYLFNKPLLAIMFFEMGFFEFSWLFDLGVSKFKIESLL